MCAPVSTHFFPAAGCIVCGSSLLASEPPINMYAKPTPAGGSALPIPRLRPLHPGLIEAHRIVARRHGGRHTRERPLPLAKHLHLALFVHVHDGRLVGDRLGSRRHRVGDLLCCPFSGGVCLGCAITTPTRATTITRLIGILRGVIEEPPIEELSRQMPEGSTPEASNGNPVEGESGYHVRARPVWRPGRGRGRVGAVPSRVPAGPVPLWPPRRREDPMRLARLTAPVPSPWPSSPRRSPPRRSRRGRCPVSECCAR